MLDEMIIKTDGLSTEERKAQIKNLKKQIFSKLQGLKESGVPIIVLVEGWSCAGKGTLINDLISEIDPRFYQVETLEELQENTGDYPLLYPFFKAIPENGKMVFFDGGWMEANIYELMYGYSEEMDLCEQIEAAARFERTLKNNGYRILKLFLDIDKKEQKKRIEKMEKDRENEWRLDDYDYFQNKEYKQFRIFYDVFMEADNEIPWHILRSDSKKEILCEALSLLNAELDDILENRRYEGAPYEEEFPLVENSNLANCDLSKSLTYQEYKEQLKVLQAQVARLSNLAFMKGIPVVCAFEGWDAAGKGGAIRRLTYPIDPRDFRVHPIASPIPSEKNRHFLWRFWTRLPRLGNFAIFDRTWYGRVMVERLEGFCSENDWKRAYNEINEFEYELTREGMIVLKFWINIDSETQLARFTERQNTPEKQWKITDEDWRNRDKWPQYEEAINEMLAKTSTEFAPWHIVASNDKLWARIEVLTIVKEALEKALTES